MARTLSPNVQRLDARSDPSGVVEADVVAHRWCGAIDRAEPAWNRAVGRAARLAEEDGAAGRAHELQVDVMHRHAAEMDRHLIAAHGEREHERDLARHVELQLVTQAHDVELSLPL